MAESEYERRVVAFLDILGFSKLVENADAPEWRSAIEGVVKTMRETLAPNPEMADLRFTQFSDCIVVSARANSLWGLYGVLSGSILLCDNLLQRQVLLRGGIAVGNLIHTEDVLFGPGLLKAYEKDSAGSPPRVSLDESVTSEIASQHPEWGFGSYIRVDPYDLRPMLHTLKKYELYTGVPAPGVEVLDKNAKYVAAAIANQCYAVGHSPAVRAKWLWLERYWNETVSVRGVLTATTPYRQ